MASGDPSRDIIARHPRLAGGLSIGVILVVVALAIFGRPEGGQLPWTTPITSTIILQVESPDSTDAWSLAPGSPEHDLMRAFLDSLEIGRRSPDRLQRQSVSHRFTITIEGVGGSVGVLPGPMIRIDADGEPTTFQSTRRHYDLLEAFVALLESEPP